MSGTIADIDAPGHACMVPDSPEHAWEATASWIAGGLDAGERVLYFEDETADRLLERLDDDRVPVRDAIDGGQFQIIPSEMTRAAVTVPMDQVEAVMMQAINETRDLGWPAMRFIGEASRARMDMGMGLKSLVDYETTIDRVLAQNPSTRLLCLYGRDQFDERAISAMRAVHPAEFTGPPAYDDGQLRVTRPRPSTLRLAGEVDYSNRGVLGRMIDDALEQTLRSVDVPVDVTLDIASLRFLDVGGALELARGAERFPTGQRLVLDAPRSRVLRALQRCQATTAPQLVIEPRPGSDERR